MQKAEMLAATMETRMVDKKVARLVEKKAAW